MASVCLCAPEEAETATAGRRRRSEIQKISHGDHGAQDTLLVVLRWFKFTTFSRRQKIEPRTSLSGLSRYACVRWYWDSEGTEWYLQREDWKEGWQVGRPETSSSLSH